MMQTGSWSPDSPFWHKWADHYDGLGYGDEYCADGIADEKRFTEAARRVLFVLKEPNQWKRADLCDQMRKGPEGLAWRNLARWAVAVLDRAPFENAPPRMAAALREVAVINLKKHSGGSSSDAAVINAFAHQDRVLLREQIRAIRPDIVVACGASVFSPLVWLLDVEVDRDGPSRRPASSPGFELTVVPWKHPSTRQRTRDLYERLLNRIAEL